MPAIILASSSPYRRALLGRLGLPFDWLSPAIDESRATGEKPRDLVSRLAEEKARTVAAHCDNEAGAFSDDKRLIIASDQVACIDDTLLTKPGNFANALAQLSRCSGRTVRFYTSLALLSQPAGRLQLSVETTDVYFRQLNEQQIRRYLEQEQPYDCSGSFKAEGLGISLFSKIVSDDPNTLIGLPLIRLVAFLEHEGIAVP